MKTCSTILLALTCFSLGVSAQTLSNYQATVKAQAPSFYFTFDTNSLANVVGRSTPVLSTSALVASQFIYDIFQNPKDCIYFSLLGDYAYDPNEGTDHIISGGGVVGTNTSNAVGTITLLVGTPDQIGRVLPRGRGQT